MRAEGAIGGANEWGRTFPDTNTKHKTALYYLFIYFTVSDQASCVQTGFLFPVNTEPEAPSPVCVRLSMTQLAVKAWRAPVQGVCLELVYFRTRSRHGTFKTLHAV